MRTKASFITVTATVTALASSAHLAVADPAIEARAHPAGGLFLQLTPGVGVAATAAKLPDGTNVSLSGVGGTFDLEIGATITGNFILAADLSATSVVGPTFKMGDAEVKSNNDVSWSTGFAGATAAYYVMPLDLRIAGGLGVFRQALDVPNMALSRSNYGGAAKLAVGKEWWVSPKWGIGINLESVAGVVPDGATKDKGWGFFGANLAVSATYR